MHQLRRLVRNVIKEALVGGADPRMSGGRVEDEMTVQKKNAKIVMLQSDARLIRAQIKKVKAGTLRGQDLSMMQNKLDEIEDEIARLKAKEKI